MIFFWISATSLPGPWSHEVVIIAGVLAMYVCTYAFGTTSPAPFFLQHKEMWYSPEATQRVRIHLTLYWLTLLIGWPFFVCVCAALAAQTFAHQVKFMAHLSQVFWRSRFADHERKQKVEDREGYAHLQDQYEDPSLLVPYIGNVSPHSIYHTGELK